jgi:hypothetical protein
MPPSAEFVRQAQQNVVGLSRPRRPGRFENRFDLVIVERRTS